MFVISYSTGEWACLILELGFVPARHNNNNNAAEIIRELEGMESR